MHNAVLIDGRDNVAVAIEPIAAGQAVAWVSGGQVHTVQALEDFPLYHKAAIRPLEAGDPVVKYGQPIGTAARPIEAGRHVHTHNVSDLHRPGEVTPHG